jgi:glutathione S-transferase
MHSGFSALRAALPMNLRAHHPGFKVWSRAQSDIVRITAISRECLTTYGGPYLFGARSMADAMYAPVVTRFQTYDVQLDEAVPPIAARSWRCRNCRSGRRLRGRNPRRSRSWTWSFETASRRPVCRLAGLAPGPAIPAHADWFLRSSQTQQLR